MSNYDSQVKIIEAIGKVVDSKLDTLSTTNSTIGFVVDEPQGFDCTVSINDHNFEAILPEHLHTWIQKDDIVIVQDLYGDGRKKVITGKTGSRQQVPTLVFYDDEKGRNVSGRDGIFDGSGNKLDGIGTVQGA